MNYLPCVEVISNPSAEVTHSVIWLHGLGADGNDFVPVVRELNLPESVCVRFVFPHAPKIPVTVNNGYVMPAWYDIYEFTLDRKIDVDQLCGSAAKVHALIARELARGVPSEKIIIAGFSQGGAVAYEAALSFDKPLAGLLALSTYFATHASIRLHESNRGLPVLIQHGLQDPVVLEVLGARAYEQLSVLGYPARYETYAMEHTLCAEQIVAIGDWLQEVLLA
jgi:phospholipase/carboxylesterase